jgi:hypothetical protein
VSAEADEATNQAQLEPTDPQARNGPHNVGTGPQDVQGPMLGGLADPDSPTSRLWNRGAQDAQSPLENSAGGTIGGQAAVDRAGNSSVASEAGENTDPAGGEEPASSAAG